MPEGPGRPLRGVALVALPEAHALNAVDDDVVATRVRAGDLLRRSVRGDIVLDPFIGSGTTAAVAHKMRRRWVATWR